MLDLKKYEGTKDCSDLLDEIRALRDAAAGLAEVVELMSAKAEPIHPGVIECDNLCREKAREALEAFRSL